MGNWSATVVNACGRLIFLFISHIGRLKIHAQFENITYRVSHFWPGKSACPSAATNFAERHCRILQSLSWLTQSYQWHSESRAKARQHMCPLKQFFLLPYSHQCLTATALSLGLKWRAFCDAEGDPSVTSIVRVQFFSIVVFFSYRMFACSKFIQSLRILLKECHNYGLANLPVPQQYSVLLRDKVESSKAYEEGEKGKIVSPLLD